MDADKEQIAEVLIRYATGIDSKDWPLLRSCWTDDIDVDYQQLGRFTTADALTDVMRQLHENMGPTYHRLSNFVIDIDEVGDRATVPEAARAVGHVAEVHELAGPVCRRGLLASGESGFLRDHVFATARIVACRHA